MIKKPIVAAVAYALCATVNQSAYAANDIEILSGSVQTNVTGINYFLTTDDSAQLGIDKITSYWNNPVSTSSITFYTTESGSNTQQGNITFSAALDFNTPGLGYSPHLYLNAHNDITLSSISDSDLLTADTLIMYLTPDTDVIGGGAVIANGAIEGDIIATINGDLVIGATGSYNLDNYLSVDSIDNSAGGSFNFNAGTLKLNNTGLTIGTGSLLGGAIVLDSTRNIELANNNVLTIDATGSVDLSGGALTVGSISNAGSFSFTSGTLTLTNSSLTVGSGGLLGSNLALDGTRNLSVSNGVTIDATGTMSIDGGKHSFASIDNSAGGTFNFNSGALSLTNSDLTVGSAGLLGSDVTLTSAHSLLQLGGNLTVDSGATLTVYGGANLYGTGTNITGNLTNYGAVIFSSSVAYYGEQTIVGGVITNDGAGASMSVGDGTGPRHVLSAGSIVNTNGAILSIDGGQLQAGSITNSNGGTFTFNSGSLYLDSLTIGTGQLLGDNFTIDATKTLGTGSGLLTIESGATLTLDGGNLWVDTVSNAGNFVFNSGSMTVGNYDNPVTDFTLDASTVFGNTLTLGNNQELNIQNGDLIVDSGSNLTLDGGALMLNGPDGLVNNGTFNFNSGLLRFQNDNGLTIGSAGALGDVVTLGTNKTLVVTSNPLTIDADASLTINGGTLSSWNSIVNNGNFSFTSGHLSAGGGLTVGNTGLLGNNVALSSNRTLSMSGGVIVETDATLSQSSGSSVLADGLTNNGYIGVTGGNLYTDDVVNNQTINIASGAAFGDYSLINNSSTISTATYTQNSGITTVNGTLAVPSVIINDGSLYGSGTIDGNLTMAGGHLRPGNSPGTLEITGDFVLTEAGTLHLEVGSDGLDPEGYLWDQLIVGGDYDLQGGLVKLSLLDGLDINNLESDFAIDDFFRTGTKDSDIGFDLLQLAMFGNLDLYAYDVSGDSWFSLALDETGGFLATASASPVPVPAAAWLFGSGLIGLIGVARRKKV